MNNKHPRVLELEKEIAELLKEDEEIADTEEIQELSLRRIGNYYGSLSIRKDGDSYYWSIENYDGHDWVMIPKSLYYEIKSFYDKDERIGEV